MGSHDVSAFYSVNSSTPVGSAVSLTQVVTAFVAGGFTLNVAPTTLSIGVGNTGDSTVTIQEAGSFYESVALTCSGLPYAATCTFANPLIASGGGTTQLLIHPEAPHNCTDTNQYFIAGASGRLGLSIAALLGLLFGWRKRRLRPLLSALLLSLLPLAGCGGTCTDLGTRPGTYTFTVTATSMTTSVVHSQTVTFHAYIDGEAH